MFARGSNIGTRKMFTKDEDIKLLNLVSIYGLQDWDQVSKGLPGKTCRQCRERYRDKLRPNLLNGIWNHEEDALVIAKFNEIGPRWTKISEYLNGRSGNDVKNRWHTTLKRQIGQSRATTINDSFFKSEDQNLFKIDEEIDIDIDFEIEVLIEESIWMDF
jgi:hypothetical protein